MNQYFDFTRFGRLLRKHTTEHGRTYLLGTIVLAGIIGLILGGIASTGGPLEREGQQAFFAIGLFGGGFIFTSFIFGTMGNSRTAAAALLLPASSLEKYLVAWLYSLLGFGVVYSGLFLAINALVLKLSYPAYPDILSPLQVLAAPAPLLNYLLLHGIALWGAIFFTKLHAIKVACLVFAGALLLVLGNMLLVRVLVGPDVQAHAPFGDATIRIGQNSWALTLPELQQATLPLLLLVLTILLWLAAYARLTEKQL